MRIKTIKWEELKSGPGYENKRAGVEIELEDGDNPDDVLVKAKAMVKAALTADSLRLGCATDSELDRIEKLAGQLKDAVANARVPF